MSLDFRHPFYHLFSSNVVPPRAASLVSCLRIYFNLSERVLLLLLTTVRKTTCFKTEMKYFYYLYSCWSTQSAHWPKGQSNIDFVLALFQGNYYQMFAHFVSWLSSVLVQLKWFT